MDHLLRRGASAPLTKYSVHIARKSYNGFPAIPWQLTMH